MINIDSLEFRYRAGEFRLRVPTLAVATGEKVAVIGPSGSGKTTLLNLISGIFTAQTGRVSVNGVEVSALNDAQRRDFRVTSIGFVFQDFELLDYLHVLDNILHPYRITQALKLDKAVRQRAVELAEAMGIGDNLKRFANDLSQGEKQRAAICRALLPQPKLILADEATGNLDPDNKTLIMDLLFENVVKHDATLLAVTHDYDLLKRFDRVIDFKQFRQREAA
ncbi:MAG: ABC transporter ATP-binding protein [Gammaproteobacteria bacterium]|nr:ABC transporter ATP-binding protein [Gammaproteobacteria bacterium]MCZ6575834.1 ABC transporter ATP-binding protein [Gammaproteobacteria bacterium]